MKKLSKDVIEQSLLGFKDNIITGYRPRLVQLIMSGLLLPILFSSRDKSIWGIPFSVILSIFCIAWLFDFASISFAIFTKYLVLNSCVDCVRSGEFSISKLIISRILDISELSDISLMGYNVELNDSTNTLVVSRNKLVRGDAVFILQINPFGKANIRNSFTCIFSSADYELALKPNYSIKNNIIEGRGIL